MNSGHSGLGETFGLWIFDDSQYPLCMTVDEFSEFRQRVLTRNEQAQFLASSTLAGGKLDRAIIAKLEAAFRNLSENDKELFDHFRVRYFRDEEARRYYKAFLDFTFSKISGLNLMRVTWPKEGVLLVDRSLHHAAPTKFHDQAGYLMFDDQVSEVHGSLTRYTLKVGYRTFVRVVDSEISFPDPSP